jgi:hypothetical protein
MDDKSSHSTAVNNVCLLQRLQKVGPQSICPRRGQRWEERLELIQGHTRASWLGSLLIFFHTALDVIWMAQASHTKDASCARALLNTVTL